jgi:hypothetical protein
LRDAWPEARTRPNPELIATLKELMARLGHSSVRAASIYQHAARDRDPVWHVCGTPSPSTQAARLNRTPKKVTDQQETMRADESG